MYSTSSAYLDRERSNFLFLICAIESYQEELFQRLDTKPIFDGRESVKAERHRLHYVDEWNYYCFFLVREKFVVIRCWAIQQMKKSEKF